ncbi:MAG: nucleotidyl transferase AbiEii/AbiGii toxin family protein [Leptospiraceae bacterium]|jgi:hypothetical protein|nr:nucleotidyl transferase AbiEii/AbiGii toxin family protein [Leptospiraceae bacterium]MCZ8347784.1 nucleotidyl transferase AbiEii/AbiGii toxin family protein [Leptospiraceae bacterium]
MQDGVLNSIKKSKVPFYLTGGTALSRAYLNHRYSDDLDLFVNNDSNFITYVESCLDQIHSDGFRWDEKRFIKTENFCQYYIIGNSDSSVKLKVDFVNDIATHFGGLTETKLFFRTDSVRNILSNKVSALFRLAAKDLVDLVFLSYRFQFDWSEIVDEAREKDSGIEVSIVAEILSSFPVQKLDEIFWVAPPDVKKIQNDIQQMAKDCLEVKSNSLCSI